MSVTAWLALAVFATAYVVIVTEKFSRTAVALLGLPAGQVMLVAAHNYDLRAARSEGWHTAFVPRPAEYGPGQTTDLAPEEAWDVVARDFVDLAEKLGA